MLDQILFRWATGDGEEALFRTHLAVASVQKYFPKNKLFILYNGSNFSQFKSDLKQCDNVLNFDNISIVQQSESDTPFNFKPYGAWWKWVPIHLGVLPIEIFLDTDIIFVRSPATISKWITSSFDMLAGRDIYNNLRCQNIGDFKSQLRLYDDIINVGLIGLKNDKWSRLFIKKSSQLSFNTPRSFHINEQGAANVSVAIAERSKVLKIMRIPMSIYSWWQPLTIDTAESIHFIADQKRDMINFYSFFRKLIISKNPISEYYHIIHFLKNLDRSNPDKVLFRKLCSNDQINRTPSNDLRKLWQM